MYLVLVRLLAANKDIPVASMKENHKAPLEITTAVTISIPNRISESSNTGPIELTIMTATT